MKTFVNEFVAYNDLGKLMKNKETFLNYTTNYNRTWEYTGDLDITFHPDSLFNSTETLEYGFLTVSTYLYCYLPRYLVHFIIA